MELCKKSECTGCMACINICPRKAIVLRQDEEGFLYPIILKDNCIKCGACVKVCPQMNPKRSAENYDKKVYAGWMKNRRLRRRSTSGGAFTAFAKEIMNNNGVVYGAGFDKDNKVIHKRITKKSELSQLRGSKYVQSYIGNTFSQVKIDLLKGKPVLFSGTPCQIDGLYSYFGNRYEKQLFTIDLVCHGVPSPEIYSKYLEYLEKQYKSKVNKVYFRDKEPGWYVFGMRVEFQNGFVYKKNTYEDPFARGFLRNLFLRPSCHSCHYANNRRIADITLADFWGYQSTNEKDYDDDKGISMIMINSSNGDVLFQQAKHQMRYFARDVEQAVQGNPALSHCFPPAENREQFWLDVHSNSFEYVIEKYMYSEEIPEWFKFREQQIKSYKNDRRKHLPNRVFRRVLGNKLYEKLKKIK